MPLTLPALPPPAPLPPRRPPAGLPFAPPARRSVGGPGPAPRGPATWLLSFVLAGLALWGHARSSLPLTLEVDGRPQALRSRAGSVGELLREQGVLLGPGDQVQPPVRQALRAGQRVTVRHARRFRLRVDGRSLVLSSLAPNARGLLAEAGIALGQGDRLLLDGRAITPDSPFPPLPGAAPTPRGGARIALAAEEPLAAAAADALPEAPAEPLKLSLLRPADFTVVEEGVSLSLSGAGATVEDVLQAAGITVDADDALAPGREARFRAGMTVQISRATELMVEQDGERRPYRVSAGTVGQALARLGLGLSGRDYSLPAADTPLQAGMLVKLVRVREDVQLREEEVPFATESEVDPELPLGEVQVQREGSPGLLRQRIVLTYENGRLVNRQVAEEEVLREPVAQLQRVGSKVIWRTVETEQGPMRYFARLRVYATSYSAARAGTPKTAPWYGITRSGLKMRKGIVAVDRRLIPLGTNLYVPGYGVGLAGDTGGGIKNFHIDLGYDDDNYVSWHQWVELYLLEPVPSGIDLGRLLQR